MPLKDKDAFKEYMKMYRRRARERDRKKWRAYKNKWRNKVGENIKSKKGRDNSEEWYIIKLFMTQTGLTRKEVLEYHMPEIKAKQLILKIKKAIKHEKNKYHKRTN